MALLVAGLSLTRMTGLVAYATTLVVCGAGWWRVGRRGRAGNVFGVLAVAQLVLLLDIVFDWRWKLHDFFMQVAMERREYGQRRPPQLLALCGLAGLVVLGLSYAVWRFRHRAGLAAAIAATLLSVALRCVEVLSYHGMDALLYSMMGSLMLVALLWLSLALLTCAGVWVDSLMFRGDR